jgi:hypothetical protein
MGDGRASQISAIQASHCNPSLTWLDFACAGRFKRALQSHLDLSRTAIPSSLREPRKMTMDYFAKLRSEMEEIERSAVFNQPKCKERLDRASDQDREKALQILLSPSAFEQWQVRKLALD